jgi:hypothetical protein
MSYGDTEGIYTEPKLKSVAQLEKIIDKKELSDFVEISRGTSMVSESDKRPAIEIKTNKDLFLEEDLEADF